MKFIHITLISLISLIVIVILAQFWSPVEFANGYPHPTYKGMFISKANIDQFPHTRWLGYLFGVSIITLFGSLTLIGVRQKGMLTSLGRYVYIGIGAYLIVFSGMVFSHWKYVANDGGPFFASMPVPTAWMIFGVWFVPLIITISFIVKFDDSVISEDDITAFRSYLADRDNPKS